MAATVELKVNINAGNALASLNDIYNKAAQIDSKTFNLKVNVQGLSALQGVSKESIQALKALSNLAKAEADLAKQEAKVRVAEEATAKARAIHQKETHQSTEATNQNTNANKENAASLENIAQKSKFLGNVMHTVASQVAHALINSVTRNIREAVTEMKNVDTELINISKVSGITGKDLSDMGDRAYETASKYGVAASEYLSAVYTFQKAGLGPSAEEMGELAVKTMLVGDTSADVASQFLISANAAWKLGGNMDRLTQIVDEADYINNNYATTLEKLSSGLPRVASIAAQAGMSAEETLAALGTITAVTQESGTKAATALRALILNIEGEVGEFVDETGESFTVTEESVKSMQGLMEKYAKSELDAAKASGELINPLVAIKAIFEGMRNSDLNDQELFQLLSGMGGKLRTNQLTALVQNWELFDEMMGKIADSAGTADSEISLMMDSWERKTQVLKNTWTEFVSDIVNSDTIKGGIEFLTNFIDGIDEVIQRIKDPFRLHDETIAEYERLNSEYGDLLKKGSDLTETERARLEYLQRQLNLLELQASAEEQAAAKKEQARLTRPTYIDGGGMLTADELKSADLNAAIGRSFFTGDVAAYQSYFKDIAQDYWEYYEAVVRVRDAGLEITDYQKEFIKDYEDVLSVASSEGLQVVGKSVEGYWAIADAQGNIVAYEKDRTEEIVAQSEELRQQAELEDKFAQAQRDAAELGITISQADKQLVDSAQWDEYIASLREVRSLTEESSDEEAQAALDRLTVAEIGLQLLSDGLAVGKDLSEASAEASAGTAAITGNLEGAIDYAWALTQALEAAAAAAQSVQTGSIGGGGASGGGGLPARASGGFVPGGGPTLVNELGPELISENGRAYIAGGGRPAVVNLSPNAIVIPADQTRVALRGGMPHRAAALNDDRVTQILTNAQYVAGLAIDTSHLNNTTPFAELAALGLTPSGEKPGETKTKTRRGNDGGGGNSGPKTPTTEELAKSLNDLLKNLDKQAKLANNQGDYLKEVQIYEQAQEAIKKMVDNYRKAGYKDSSDEILDLLNKNYDYANKQLTLYQSKWDDLIKALQADTDAQEMANKLAEKQQAVEDAREALANAQKQRTIRMYNAATGQWEWVADQSAVSSAQEKLSKAEESYADEVKSQAVAELKAMRDTVADLNNVILGPALSSVVTMAENSDEFQNFARALNAVYGIGSYLSSTEGSSKVISTADSHDTVYTFGNVTLTEDQASSMSVAELAKKLSVLKIS